MDTSSEYKNMCQQAERAAPELFYKSSYSVHDYVFKVEGNDLLWWLPRQDQLQDMMDLPTWRLVYNFSLWFGGVMEVGAEPIWKQYSMEQLWLAFVMQEKYNKTWNGNGWQ